MAPHVPKKQLRKSLVRKILFSSKIIFENCFLQNYFLFSGVRQHYVVTLLTPPGPGCGCTAIRQCFVASLIPGQVCAAAVRCGPPPPTHPSIPEQRVGRETMWSALSLQIMGGEDCVVAHLHALEQGVKGGFRQCVVILPPSPRTSGVRTGCGNVVVSSTPNNLYHHGPWCRGCGGCGSSALWSTAVGAGGAALLVASSSRCIRATSRRAAFSFALSRCCFIIPEGIK